MSSRSCQSVAGLIRSSTRSSARAGARCNTSWQSNTRQSTIQSRLLSLQSRRAAISHASGNFTSIRCGFATSAAMRHGHLQPPQPGQERIITILDKDLTPHTFTVSDGDNILDIAQAHDLEMEGACGGSCACSTCHIIVDSSDLYDAMEEPDDDENDMLDLAFGLTETSRLGCQVKMSKELDGLVVRLPSMTRNLQASDFVERKKEGG